MLKIKTRPFENVLISLIWNGQHTSNPMDLLRTPHVKGSRSLNHFIQSHDDFFREKRLDVSTEDKMDAIFGVFRNELKWNWMETVPSECLKKYLNFLRAVEHILKCAPFLKIDFLESFRFRVFANLVRVLDTSSTEPS